MISAVVAVVVAVAVAVTIIAAAAVENDSLAGTLVLYNHHRK